jgi:hypothetical protein
MMGVGATTLLLIASVGHVAAELVANPGFETGDFSGWTTDPDPFDPTTLGVENTHPHSGAFNAYFGGEFINSISQNIATVPGHLYQLTFWLRNDGGLQTAEGGENEFQVSFGGVDQLDFFDSEKFDYERFILPGLLATSASTVLKLGGFHFNNSFFRLDDVSLLPCPPLDNAAHNGPPIVNLYALDAGGAAQPVPTTIEFGEPLSLLATAVGNPPSYNLVNFSFGIFERIDVDPLHPDPAHSLPTWEQHNSGVGAGRYSRADLSLSPFSTTGAQLLLAPPELPILPPGYYEIRAFVRDCAGFSASQSNAPTILTVSRSFGFLSVVSLERHVNSDCPETQICQSDFGDFALPCNTTNFSAVLNLINNTDDSGIVRVRLVSVAGGAYTFSAQDSFNAQLPAERDLTPAEASVGPVGPLAGCSAQQVQICGVIPAPQQQDCELGFGFQLYAVLDQCDPTIADCSNPTSDGWISVDSIKVTEGEWPIVNGRNGPGGGANQDRRGVRKNDPFRLASVTVTGPTTAGESTAVRYFANAILRNSTGTTKALSNVRARWSASRFVISPTTGVFRAGQVTAPTPVRITARFRYGGVTRTGALTVLVTPRGASTASTAAAVDFGEAEGTASSSTPSSTMSAGMSDEAMAEADYTLAQASPQMAVPADAVPARGTGKRRHKKSRAPAVSLTVSSPTINEGGSAVFRVLAPRTDRSRPLTINYTLGGSAILNTHFVVCGTIGQVTIPAGASTATINLSAMANDLDAGAEVATVSLMPGRGYKLTRRRIQNVTILNLPAPVSIESCPALQANVSITR